MNELTNSLTLALRQPDPAALVRLHGALLAYAAPGDDRDQALQTTSHFHEFLVELRGKLTARQFSELASWLDVAAVGMVAFGNILSGDINSLRDVIPGLLAEGFMVAASRQYVKAWEVESTLTHERALWFLREALWQVSVDNRPDLPPAERLELVANLLGPAGEEVVSSQRIVVLANLFQTLLLIHAGGLVQSSQR